MFVRRNLMLRRMVAKHHGVQQRAERILERYADMGYVGTFNQELGLTGLLPAPPTAEVGRTRWKPKMAPKGPIGLLLANAHLLAAAVKPGFVTCQLN